MQVRATHRALCAPDRNAKDYEQWLRVMPQLGAVRRLRSTHAAAEFDVPDSACQIYTCNTDL